MTVKCCCAFYPSDAKVVRGFPDFLLTVKRLSCRRCTVDKLSNRLGFIQIDLCRDDVMVFERDPTGFRIRFFISNGQIFEKKKKIRCKNDGQRTTRLDEKGSPFKRHRKEQPKAKDEQSIPFPHFFCKSTSLIPCSQSILIHHEHRKEFQPWRPHGRS